MRNAYQQMVQEYYVDRIREMNSRRAEALGLLETADDVLEYQTRIRRAVSRAFGSRPRRTPLNPRITGRIQRPHHTIEKLVFESRPGVLVTASLYLPRELLPPVPAVVAPCGHTENGKAGDLYQGFCQRLTRSGFIVLIYDPYNQGERDQYQGVENREPVSGCCNAHNMMGKQIELLGQFFGMWRAWDGIRALDYLLTRPEVDKARVGLTGNSGGGTMTEWIWALDDRFTMAAPGCFVTTYLANLENELPQDCEQYPPGILGAGLEMADLMILRAPKPAILLGQAYDYFDRRGLRKAYEDLRMAYGILGHAGNVKLFIGPHGHGYHRENQEAMVRFFSRHAGVRPVPLRETEVLEERDLWATPEGNVVAFGGRPIFDVIGEIADGMVKARKEKMMPLRRSIMRVLGVSSRRGVPSYRVLRPVGSSEERWGRYAVETEPGIMAILRRRAEVPESVSSLEPEEEMSLYVPNLSVEAEGQEYAEGSGWVPSPFYGLDPRGMGESMPEGGEEGFYHPYGLDYMYHGYGLLLGKSYLGRRVHDILSTMDLLVSRGARSIGLYGMGQGSILALFAGLIHRAAGEVVLKNAPRSFAEWAHAPIVTWPAANFPRGILAITDVAECCEALGSSVRVIDSWGPRMGSRGAEANT